MTADDEGLDRFSTLLRDEGARRGLISTGDRERVRERHVEDSLRAGPAFRPGDKLAYDLGSGAGLPGIPLAIALPEVQFVLAEVRRARAAFLEMAVERLGLRNVRVHHGRAEELPPEADVATARAFADLEGSWRIASGILRDGGRLVYFGGESLEAPLEVAARASEAHHAAKSSLLVDSPTPLVMMEKL